MERAKAGMKKMTRRKRRAIVDVVMGWKAARAPDKLKNRRLNESANARQITRGNRRQRGARATRWHGRAVVDGVGVLAADCGGIGAGVVAVAVGGFSLCGKIRGVAMAAVDGIEPGDSVAGIGVHDRAARVVPEFFNSSGGLRRAGLWFGHAGSL